MIVLSISNSTYGNQLRVQNSCRYAGRGYADIDGAAVAQGAESGEDGEEDKAKEQENSGDDDGDDEEEEEKEG